MKVREGIKSFLPEEGWVICPCLGSTVGLYSMFTLILFDTLFPFPLSAVHLYIPPCLGDTFSRVSFSPSMLSLPSGICLPWKCRISSIIKSNASSPLWSMIDEVLEDPRQCWTGWHHLLPWHSSLQDYPAQTWLDLMTGNTEKAGNIVWIPTNNADSVDNLWPAVSIKSNRAFIFFGILCRSIWD